VVVLGRGALVTVDRGGSDPGDELVDVVDEHDSVIEVVTRREVRARNLRHRCTYVVVLNSAGELYVHKRTDTKDVYPGFYDLVAGGVNGSGESFDGCAMRELDEELGVPATPTFRFRLRYEGPSGRIIGAAYDVVWDGPILHQPSEVVWGTYLPFDEVEAMISREDFCPDGLEVFERWRHEREATRG
jgi:8-oxo-dGTP pyrophosphatase MutT (NUDIX family)